MAFKKLTINEIKIKSPSQQIKEAILKIRYNIDMSEVNNRVVSKYIEKFADEIGMYAVSVKQYLKDGNKDPIGTEPFREKLIRMLDKGYNELVLSDLQQATNLVANVNDNIEQYLEDSDISILEKIKDICIKYNMRIETSRMYRLIASNLLANKKSTERAIELLQVAMSLLNSIDNSEIIDNLECLNGLGLGYILETKYELAKETFDRMKLKIDEYNIVLNRKFLYYFYYRQGCLYSDIGDYVLSRDMFNRAFEYTETSQRKGHITLSIGVTYKCEKNYSKAIEYYDSSLKYFDNDFDRSRVYNNKSELYKELGDLDSAESFIMKALSYLANENININYYIYKFTQLEIKILRGEREITVKELLELLNNPDEMNKQYFLTGFDLLMDIGKKNNDLLIFSELRKLLLRELRKTTYDKFFSNNLKQRFADLYIIMNLEVI